MVFLVWLKYLTELPLVQFMSKLVLRILKGNLGQARKALREVDIHNHRMKALASNLSTTCHPLHPALKVEAA
jgi:hypothetical protein